MTGRRAIVGLCMLCALFVSAFAAQGAAAATKGTTAFTCAAATVPGPKTTVGFKDAHCTEPTANDETHLSNVKFEHVGFEGVTAEGRLSNEKTKNATTEAEPGVLKSTFGGFAVTLTAATAEATGTLTNMKAASGEHTAEAAGSITFKEVKATHACTVWTDIPGSPPTMGEQGVVHTEPLIGTTAGQGDAVKIEPVNAEKVFARFWLTECDAPAINGTYTIKGSVKATPKGATLEFVHATTTAEETLLTNGTVPAGIAGKATLSARANNTQAYTPISPTTVETP